MIWQRYPLFRAFLAYVAGILIANSTQISWWIWLLLLVIFSVAALITAFHKKIFFTYENRKWFGMALPLLFLSLGGFSLQIYFKDHLENRLKVLDNQKSFLLITILDDPAEKERSYGSKVRIEKAIKKGEKFTPHFTVMLYLQKSKSAAQLRYGDQILVCGTLQLVKPPANPYQFDYQRYLKLKSIYHQAYADSASWEKVAENQGNFFLAGAKQFRRNALKVVNAWDMPEDEKSVSKALLLGYRNDIQDELLEAYQSAGAVHVLAVSGLHVGIIYIILLRILSFLKHHKNGLKIRAFMLLAVLWFFAMVTGLSSSVVRAVTMFSFVALGTGFNRKTSVYNTILASAFLLMFFRPTYLFDVGFQLSYFAVFAIVWLQPKLAGFWKPKTWVVKQFWDITTVSIAAQIGTFPLALFYFHQFPSLFLVSNWAVIPLITILMYLGLLTLIVSWAAGVSSFISEFLVTFYSTFLSLMNYAVNWVNSQAEFLIGGIHISVLEMILLYVFVLAIGTWLTLGKYWRLALATSAITILLLSQFVEKQGFEKNGELVVYSINKQSALGFYHQNIAVFIADSSLFNDRKTFGFNIQNHWWAQDAENIKKMDFNANYCNDFFSKKSNLLQCFDTIIYFYKNDEILPEADIWMVQEKRYPPKGKLNTIPAQIILSGNVPFWQRKEWREWAETENIPIWDVLEMGAYRLKIKA